MKTHPTESNKASARSLAVRAVSQFLRSDPDFHAAEWTDSTLDARDSRLAVAIYRATIQRWLTLEFLLNRFLRKRLDQTPASLQAVLLTGAAQLLFMDKQPAHAVVNEAVAMSRRLGHASAAGLVNAVLRKIEALPRDAQLDEPWSPSPNAVPLAHGRLWFEEAWFPPVKTLDRYLSISTSHPHYFVERAIKQFGRENTTALLLHTHQAAPTTVYCVNPPPEGSPCIAHETPGFVCWQGAPEGLAPFLGAVQGWVQDPASHRAVASTKDDSPSLIVDYCAGKGTKTRQLAFLHPRATILATDTDATRFGTLRQVFAGHARVKVVTHEELLTNGRKADLLLLDVPCSNSAVLARRLEARYRFSPQSVRALCELQRTILDRSMALLKPGGRLLYSTCSLDTSENEEQARAACTLYGLTLLQESTMLPSVGTSNYHDGSYYALMSKRA